MKYIDCLGGRDVKTNSRTSHSRALRPEAGDQGAGQCTLGCLQVQVPQENSRADWKNRRKG